MKKTIIGIILFLLQISVALYFSQSIDLIVIAGIAVVMSILIIYKQLNNKYSSPEA
jgi:hypothetical protein